MKFKIVANGTIMESGITAQKAINLICGIMQVHEDNMRIEVYYLSGNCWKLENSFVTGPANYKAKI